MLPTPEGEARLCRRSPVLFALAIISPSPAQVLPPSFSYSGGFVGGFANGTLPQLYAASNQLAKGSGSTTVWGVGAKGYAVKAVITPNSNSYSNTPFAPAVTFTPVTGLGKSDLYGITWCAPGISPPRAPASLTPTSPLLLAPRRDNANVGYAWGKGGIFVTSNGGTVRGRLTLRPGGACTAPRRRMTFILARCACRPGCRSRRTRSSRARRPCTRWRPVRRPTLPPPLRPRLRLSVALRVACDPPRARSADHLLDGGAPPSLERACARFELGVEHHCMVLYRLAPGLRGPCVQGSVRLQQRRVQSLPRPCEPAQRSVPRSALSL